MKRLTQLLTILMGLVTLSAAQVSIEEAEFGESLGGWKKRSKQYAQYQLSGTTYRTYRPESSITPDGGTYVSLRIDHRRGWFSSDDYAILEITIDKRGHITSAQSNIAIQGMSISSDMIQGVNKAGGQVSSIDRAVQIGTDLVSDLSSKILRSKVVEAGRVSFPSAVRHNYNLLYQSIRVDGDPVEPAKVSVGAIKESSTTKDVFNSSGLQIKAYSAPSTVAMPKK